MYARLLASDATCNGHFFTGVLTTGIYCLPSCKARKPRPENVRFFPSCEAARAAGLRPCRKCHPDDFAAGADPVQESIERLVAEVRAAPGAFRDAAAVVRRSGFGTTRLFELVRQHFHATPAELLLRARLEQARDLLLRTEQGLAAIAGDAGFESLSVFHDQFRRSHGLTPAAFRALRSAHSFELTLPAGYPIGHLRRFLARDSHSVTERLEGDTYTLATRVSRGIATIALTFADRIVRVTVVPEEDEPAGCGADLPPYGADAHALAVRLLGLEQDAAGFARLARRLGFGPLVAGREELRLCQTPTVYDGLLWSIIGQQINLGFAFRLRRRLMERTGRRLPNGLFAPPTPAAVASLAPGDLLALQYSRQKADYILAVSRRIAEGAFAPEDLRRMSATRVERTLLELRGFGPWSVNYVMMRSLGLADCVPLGDTGLTSGLQSLLRLEQRPDRDATRRLMAVFSPQRSLATAHLWQLGPPAPLLP